jgi:hypothetical protein
MTDLELLPDGDLTEVCLRALSKCTVDLIAAYWTRLARKVSVSSCILNLRDRLLNSCP